MVEGNCTARQESGVTGYKPIIRFQNIKAVLCIFHLSDLTNQFRLVVFDRKDPLKLPKEILELHLNVSPQQILGVTKSFLIAAAAGALLWHICQSLKSVFSATELQHVKWCFHK